MENFYFMMSLNYINKFNCDQKHKFDYLQAKYIVKNIIFILKKKLFIIKAKRLDSIASGERKFYNIPRILAAN